MAITPDQEADLSDLIPDLKSEMSAPGLDLFPAGTNAQWLSQLRNAFWEAWLDGFMGGYSVDDDGIVTPDDDSGVVLGRGTQQLIIFYAYVRILKSQLLNLKTTFRAKAGPVEYETQQAASVLKALLDDAIDRRNVYLAELSTEGSVSPITVDMVIARNDAQYYGDTWFVSSKQNPWGAGWGFGSRQ